MRLVALVLGVAALAGCGTLGEVIGMAQPACEPATGLTYTVWMRAGDKGGYVERSGASNAACVAPAGVKPQLKLESKVLCLVADGSSLITAWDADTNSGVVYRSKTKLPGCSK